MLTYTAYGFTIRSEIELPELREADFARAAASADVVTFVLGSIPPCAGGERGTADGYRIRQDGLLLEVPGVARLLATAGNHLTIEPARHADPHAIAIYVKGSGLAALMHQAGHFPLHAAAVKHDGGCIAFLGDSGHGKSTLAAMMARRGLHLVSDDVVLIRPSDDGVPCAEPSLPVLKLWPASLGVSGHDHMSAPFEAAEHRKHRIASAERFTMAALPMRRIYFLSWLFPASAAVEIDQLSPFEAMLALRPNVFRPSLIGGLGHETAYLGFASRLMSNVTAFHLARAHDLRLADAQVDAVLTHIRSV